MVFKILGEPLLLANLNNKRTVAALLPSCNDALLVLIEDDTFCELRGPHVRPRLQSSGVWG